MLYFRVKRYSDEKIKLQTENNQLKVELELLRNASALWLNEN